MGDFELIVQDIMDNEEFKKINNIRHHKGTRLDHSLLVAKKAYLFARRHNLDYKTVARAGLLHDFFLEDYKNLPNIKDRIRLICNHGEVSKKNANRFNLNEKEANIIASHMFPLGKEIPRSKEAWLICLIDKTSATSEFIKNFSYCHFIQLMFLTFIVRLI